MTEQSTDAPFDSRLAATASMLATYVLHTNASNKSTRSLAMMTLNILGIDFTAEPGAAVSEDERDEDADASGVDLTSITSVPQPGDLVWPPPVPALPAVYTENYYHAREDIMAAGPNEVALAVPVKTDDKLVFTGDARWENGGWRMKMRLEGQLCWLPSKELRPGGEIPEEHA